MNENAMPFGNLEDAFQGQGTAPALASQPVESLDLSEDVPVAYRPDEVSREATRYLLFVGDLITPRQKRERKDLRLGGEYFGQQYRTLVRSKYVLRRCQITPLEPAFDFISDEVLGDNPNHLVVAGQLAPSSDAKAPINLGGRLNAVQVYPGDEIRSILIGDYNQDQAKGIVEVKSLATIAYDEFKKSGIQEFIFPEWKEILAGIKSFPTKLSDLDVHFKERYGATRDEDLRSVIETYQLSSEQFREWGLRYLKYASMLVRQPAHQGHVYVYPDLAELLFDMLDVRREDLLTTDTALAEIISKAQQGNSISGAEVVSVLNKMTELQAQMAQFMMGGGLPKPVETVAKCKATTASSEQCKNDAGDDGYCNIPAHRPVKEE